jgi:hypothetical protein
MRDAETTIREELECIAPADDSHGPSWEDVLRRARPPQDARRRLLIAIPVVLVAIALPAVALSSGIRHALGIGSPPKPVLKWVQLLAAAPVGNGFYAHAFRAPSTTGGTCVFLEFNYSATRIRPILANGSGVCNARGGKPLDTANAALPLAPGLTIARRLKNGRPRKWVPPVVFGSVYSKLHATRIAIEWNGGSHELVLRDGWFLGGTPALYLPAKREFPFNVVAYDSKGRTVAHKTLDPKVLELK